MAINSGYNFISNTFAPWVVNQPVAIATGILCAIPALELGIRAYQDASDLYATSAPLENVVTEAKQNRFDSRNKLINELISHLAKAILLGACALNVFPASGGI